MYDILFSREVEKIIERYKKSNSNLIKKLKQLQEELELHPRTGTGHPEPLKGGQNTTYSRRLTAHDRIIYDIFDEEVYVLILSIGGHYKDK
jgi:toxin YoeB